MDAEPKLTVPVLAWAARDTTGHLAPYKFNRREPGPNDVKFDVKFCGICHSDWHDIKSEWKSSHYPLVPGHEVTGIVSETGSNVTKFRVGDRIGVGCMANSCHRCSSCHEGLEQYCPGLVWTYNSIDTDGTVTQGGYSNIMVVREDFAFRLPDNLPMDAAAPLMCAGITVFSPMKHFGMCQAGKNFGVVGLGGLGHMAAKMAKAFGMRLTIISHSPHKEEEARKRLGADHFISSRDKEQMTKGTQTLDYIINTLSVPHAVDPYLNLLKLNGKIVFVGLPPEPLKVMPSSLIFGRRSMGGSLIGSIKETQEMLDFCGEKNVTCEIEKIPITYVNEAMARLIKGDVHYRFVIDVANSLKE